MRRLRSSRARASTFFCNLTSSGVGFLGRIIDTVEVDTEQLCKPSLGIKTGLGIMLSLLLDCGFERQHQVDHASERGVVAFQCVPA